MSRKLLLLLVPGAISFVITEKEPKEGCSVDPFAQTFSPIVLLSGSDKFLYPPYDSQNLQFDAATAIDIACPGASVTVNGKQNGGLIQATCKSGTTFTIGGADVSWSHIDCSAKAWTTARYTSQTCEDGSSETEIGFEISSSRFLRTITVCFNETAQGPNYSQYSLTSSIGNEAIGVPRPNWLTPSDIYSLDVSLNTLYTRKSQQQTVNSLLGLEATSEKYIHNSNDYFLSKGHLTAKADFFFGHQQNTTFWYINAAPQWQTFNGENWERIESSLRRYADANALDLQVWTGVYGVTTLPHERTGEEIELYLYVDKNNNKALPVPELYWKVAYDPVSRLGVALLGVNNPYKADVSGSIICTDISDSIDWIDWNKSDIKGGYIYACEIGDFRQTIKNLPRFTVTGLLI